MKQILARTACVVLLAGCGGGGGTMPASPTQNAQATKVAFSITIPARSQTQSGARRPQYVSSGTQSISVTVTPSGGSALPAQTFNVTPTSNGCAAASGGGTTCTETVDAGVGSDTFAVACYSSTNAGGSVLATGSTTQTIVIDTTNTVAVTLGGVIASMAVVAPSTMLENAVLPTSYSIQVGLIAKDASGAVIIGSDPFVNGPVTLTMSDPAGAVSGGSASFTNPMSTTTVTYNGNPDRAGATFALTASGIPTANATMKSFGPPVPANLALWLDGSDAGTLTAGGSNVSAWNDKSGAGNNLTQATAADMPQLVAPSSTMHGRGSVSFNGSSQFLQTAGNFVSAFQPQTTVFVLRNQNAPVTANDSVFGVSGGNDRTQRFQLHDPYSASVIWDYGNDTNSALSTSGTYPGVHLIEAGGNQTAATAYLSIDGSLKASIASVTAPPSFASSLTLGEATVVSTTRYYNGAIGEMLVYGRALSTTETQNVEGYLAWRWGTQALLPTSHPYGQFPYSCRGPLVNGQLTCS
jgi:hypothetical protein